MAEPQTPDRPAPAEEKLFTLSEISQRTGISMPTLQRYKKTYQGRIPSEGLGRKQRYPEHALPVFEELRTENAGKRGRPRKDAAATAGNASGSSAAKSTPTRRPRAAAKRGAGGRRRAASTGRGRGKRAAGAAATPARRRGRPRRAAGAPATAAAGRRAAAGGRRATGGRRAAAGGRRAAAAGARRGPGRPRKVTPVKRGPGRPPGRPPGRRTAAGRRPRAAAAQRGKTAGLLTLTSISKTTGISYPTLVRYVRLYSNRLPHEGKGRARRFHPEAVEVFRNLRQQSGRGGRRAGVGAGSRRGAPGTARRGRPPKSAGITGRVEQILAKRVRDLEKFQKAVEKRFGRLVKGLQKLR